MGEAKRRREEGAAAAAAPWPSPTGWHRVEWEDAGLEPRAPANPDHPHGVDLDLSEGRPGQSCLVMLPHPARRIGAYVVECMRCGLRAAATTAGRPDDPRSMRMPCQAQPGRTGDYPDGVSARPGDQGALNVAVSNPDAAGNLYIDFGTPVVWWTLGRAQVVDFALTLLQRAGIKVERQGGRG